MDGKSNIFKKNWQVSSIRGQQTNIPFTILKCISRKLFFSEASDSEQDAATLYGPLRRTGDTAII